MSENFATGKRKLNDISDKLSTIYYLNDQSLNSISTTVTNNNQLLNNINDDISGINTTLAGMNTKLDQIINMMSEVKNVSELNIDDLADAYKDYYENNNVNLQQKMNFIIQYLKDNGFVKTN